MYTFNYISVAPCARWCHILKITKELSLYESEVWNKYAETLRFNLLIGFRCLLVQHCRPSFSRYYKERNQLCLDLTIIEEEIRPFYNGRYHPLDFCQQRKLMGNVFFPFLKKTFENYRNKLPSMKIVEKDFLHDTKEWLIVYDWL